jgi:uncharacterized membrane protein
MSSEPNPEEEEAGADESSAFSRWFFIALALGFGLIFVGGIIAVLAVAQGRGSGSSGVVIFIGPFPLVFGAGPDSGWLILIGVVIAVVSLVMFLVFRRKLDDDEKEV